MELHMGHAAHGISIFKLSLHKGTVYSMKWSLGEEFWSGVEWRGGWRRMNMAPHK